MPTQEISDAITSLSGDITGIVTDNLTTLVGIFAVLFVVGLLPRLVKRFAKG